MTSETMRPAGVIILAVVAMSLALGCLGGSSPTFVEASSARDDGGGGLLYIPSNASLLAHCPSSCGDIDIFYPFGIGPGCFRQGFKLTCDHTAQPPKLFLGNTTTEITDLYVGSSMMMMVQMFFNITMEPGMNTYNISWVAPTKGITMDHYNTFYVLGCDLDVILFDYARNPVGLCTSRCRGEKAMPNGGPCNGIGCCSVSLTNETTGFRATFVRADDSATQSDGIVAFMSGYPYYQRNTTDLFSGLTNASNVYGSYLRISITDQPNCESAIIHNNSYACAAGSICQNASNGGYHCQCPTSLYGDNNPYLSEGCQDYNLEHKEHCPTSCGTMDIPFPFGLKEGCYASKRFQLNCTTNNTTVFSWGHAQYHVTGVSVENGTLTVSSMLNNASSEKEVMLVLHENGEEDSFGSMEDDFDFSMEYNIVIKWAVINSTCQQASWKNNTKYACRSVHSYCKEVTHGRIFMGYRCICSSGFHGNPYILDGCTGSSLPLRIQYALLL